MYKLVVRRVKTPCDTLFTPQGSRKNTRSPDAAHPFLMRYYIGYIARLMFIGGWYIVNAGLRCLLNNGLEHVGGTGFGRQSRMVCFPTGIHQE